MSTIVCFPGFLALAAPRCGVHPAGTCTGNPTELCFFDPSVWATQCGSLGNIAVVHALFSGKAGGDSLLRKTFTRLPPHRAAQLDLRFLRIDAALSGSARLLVDGAVAWEQPPLGEVPPRQICGHPADGGGGDFIERTFAVPTPHEALRVRLLFVKVDSWDNELALLLVDGTRTP
ncbi:hypothetical protein EMIHUDRAFT_197899 [Emiliania huxleyi CCMP1516]|uniref:Uncharacterized protein n=2 Tax=Emiliania huxleyi TaxID=2903 RepID=A0A0D3IDX5_EMIH1|nr:hypothetical protein EMIHUDRAFT_197899 [Emiliania huxleyi CCMP1516]EOD09460.1 hypothetical protein EMIHUDRAFT_197899 [Emiliania huxleyi CCMP1516]|eukprot:XP_005761889.1 hypothetical protein EMIHUDRAFT_197899 [Emiliania huxleyi CCMP1516]